MSANVGDITNTVISGPFVLAGLLALAAGFVSFASPCVVPLVPGYLSYLAGLVGAETAQPGTAQPGTAQLGTTQPGTGSDTAHAGTVERTTTALATVRWRAVGATCLFIAGFSAVFVAESALVLGVYTSLIENQQLLLRISGGVAIVMGLVLAGAVPLMQGDWRPGMRRVSRRSSAGTSQVGKRGRLWGAPILGAAFGTGWLACTSPTLAGIIALSATEWNGNAVRGLALVVLYCAGLGIPFVLLAIGFGWAGTALGFLRRHARGIQIGGGVLLVAIGIAMLTGLWGYVLAPLQGTVLLL